jgi:hypothetical protein
VTPTTAAVRALVLMLLLCWIGFLTSFFITEAALRLF